MKVDAKVNLDAHTAELQKIYDQRRVWLFVSSVVYISIIIGIAGWEYIDLHSNKKIFWVVVSLGLLISINWWYWTMHSIGKILRNMHNEYQILLEITDDIEKVKVIMECKKTSKDTYCQFCPNHNDCFVKEK